MNREIILEKYQFSGFWSVPKRRQGIHHTNTVIRAKMNVVHLTSSFQTKFYARALDTTVETSETSNDQNTPNQI